MESTQKDSAPSLMGELAKWIQLIIAMILGVAGIFLMTYGLWTGGIDGFKMNLAAVISLVIAKVIIPKVKDGDV